jgi:hypothetical protein
MPAAGLEPARPKAADFKSAASTIPPGGHNQHVKCYIFTLTDEIPVSIGVTLPHLV